MPLLSQKARTARPPFPPASISWVRAARGDWKEGFRIALGAAGWVGWIG